VLHAPRPNTSGVPARFPRQPRREAPSTFVRSSSVWTGVAIASLLAVVVLIAAAPNHARWSAGADDPLTTLPDPRVGETATGLPDGTILVAGGQGLDGKPLASAELYDTGSGTWTSTGSMHVARWHHTATLLLDGTVLVAGGTREGDTVASPETYDARTGIWTLIRSAPPG
jgi:hypothetical protein